jgi:hypothetical protein
MGSARLLLAVQMAKSGLPWLDLLGLWTFAISHAIQLLYQYAFQLQL